MIYKGDTKQRTRNRNRNHRKRYRDKKRWRRETHKNYVFDTIEEEEEEEEEDCIDRAVELCKQHAFLKIPAIFIVVALQDTLRVYQWFHEVWTFITTCIKQKVRSHE